MSLFSVCDAQVKISQMPRYNGWPDSVQIPVQLGSANYKVTGASIYRKAGQSQANRSIYLGLNTGAADNVNSDNVGIGYQVLQSYIPVATSSHTGGTVAIGFEALKINTTGRQNVAIGWKAMTENLSGYGNTSLGFTSMYHNTTGLGNVALGIYTLHDNRTGYSNVAIGQRTLQNNTIGITNVAVGREALNVASGVIDAITVTNGGSGYTSATVTISAPRPTTEGGLVGGDVQATATAQVSGGAVVGITVTDPGLRYDSATVTITGDGSGATATATLKAADWNTAIGTYALFQLRTGFGNNALGRHSGYGSGGNEASLVDSFCQFLGYYASRHTSISNAIPINKSTAIGYNAKVSVSNALVLGGTGPDTSWVGIGTHAPGKMLDVVGTVRFATGNEGAGKVLTSTADGSAYWATASGGGWSLTGNTGNDTTVNWIGNNDNVPLVFRLNGFSAGMVSSTGQTFYGYQAGNRVPGVAASNTAYGYRALSSTITGSNTAIGYDAGRLITGGFNTALGRFAMDLGTAAGASNTALGAYTMRPVTGANNTTVGTLSYQFLTSGSSNVGVGVNAGGTTTTGSQNVNVGLNTNYLNLTGNSNVAVGYYSLSKNISSFNVAIGYNSGSDITTGSYNVILGGNVGTSIATFSRHILISDGEGNIRQTFDSVGKSRIGTGFSTGDRLELDGNLSLMNAGDKIKIATGSDASVGTATLSAGTVTVNTTAVTASSKIFATLTSCASCGAVYIGTITAGTSFVINSSNVGDASTVNWWIVN